ncbi:hypothetical protein [Pseudotabrizicola sp. L79]
MTDRISLALGGVIVAAICLDLFANGGQALLFLAPKFAALVDWVIFWN